MIERIIENGLCNFCVRGNNFRVTPTEHMDYKGKDSHRIGLEEQDGEFTLEVKRKTPDAHMWHILYKKRILYCPFCGTKLRDLKSIRSEANKRYAKNTS